MLKMLILHSKCVLDIIYIKKKPFWTSTFFKTILTLTLTHLQLNLILWLLLLLCNQGCLNYDIMGPFRLYFGMIYGYIVPKSVYIEPFLAIVGKTNGQKNTCLSRKNAHYAVTAVHFAFLFGTCPEPFGLTIFAQNNGGTGSPWCREKNEPKRVRQKFLWPTSGRVLTFLGTAAATPLGGIHCTSSWCKRMVWHLHGTSKTT